MDWQPIETAPRDGTAVLIAYDSSYYEMTSTDDPATWMKCSGVTIANFVAKYGREWWEGGYAEYSDECERYTATHWMPLPALPPTGAARDK